MSSSISRALFLSAAALILATAVFLRTWGMDYDTIHPDDPKQVIAARKFLEGNYTYALDNENRHIRGYPFFAMHMVEWTYRGYERILRHLTPTVAPPRTALPVKKFEIFLRRTGLALNILYELAALGLVFVIGRRLFDPWVGLAAAGIFAVSSLRIQVAHVVGADLPESLATIGVFFFSVRLRGRERLLDYLGVGICAGLAAAAKYHGFLSLLAPALVFLELRRREGWRSLAILWRWVGPLVVLAGFAAAFVLATPSLILAPGAAFAAIVAAIQATVDYWIPPQYAGRRFAYAASIWYHHINNFLRFFEPLPGWLALIALGVFAARRRLRESFLWIYPLVLFPLGAYGFPESVSYHYLGILVTFYWILAFALVEGIRYLGKAWVRIPAVALLGGWALLAAASDTSLFAIPSAAELSEWWYADCPTPGLFRLAEPRLAKDSPHPRLLGIDFGQFSSRANVERKQEEAAGRPVARFELEKRSPTLNHIRNRPHRIFWEDGKGRDVELFPPPRRTVTAREALVFPENMTLSRSSALLTLPPGEPVVRRIRRAAGDSAWLLYAHYPVRSEGRGQARLRISYPGGRRSLRVVKGGDLFVEVDLRRADLLYNGLFATVRLWSNEPLFVWLVSPQERGWFLLMMERWQELEAWEARGQGWKSATRLAIARAHRGEAPPPGALLSCEQALPDFRTGAAADLYRGWTRGVDLGLYAEPHPRIPLERFVVRTADDELTPPDLPPGGTLAGPHEDLVPGFYRVVYQVSGSGGEGALEYRITGAARAMIIAAVRSPLPEGRQEVSIPLRVTPSAPGWDLEFLVINQGRAPVRIDEVRVENEPELQLRWWLGEMAAALGDRDGATGGP